jgi:hypothetical protein
VDLKLLRSTFPLVSSAFTLPVTTMALALAGVVVAIRRKRDPGGQHDVDFEQTATLAPMDPALSATEAAPRGGWKTPGHNVDRAPGAFFAVQILGPISVLTVPSTPIFGGVKHFMPASPYIASLAAIGFVWLVRELGRAIRPWLARRRAGTSERRGGWLPVAAALVLVMPAVSETQRSHPDGLSHYNLLAGGFAGGASLGMNRQFWGYSVLPLLPSLAAHTPGRRNVYWHDVLGDALNLYIRDGRLPPGMGNTGVGEDAIRRSDMGIIIHERHMNLYEGVFWDNYQTVQPAWVRTREGVPLVTGYQRPGAAFEDLTRP